MNTVLEFVSVCPLEQNISISAYFSIPFRSFAILEIYIDKKKAYELLRGCLVYDFKQQFLVFKQHFTHFNTLFQPHVFPQMFSNNNFQFLNTCTKRALYDPCAIIPLYCT